MDEDILKNKKNEDFSFIVTCEDDGWYYKYFDEIEVNIENIKKEEELQKKLDMVIKFKKKVVCFLLEIL